MAQLAIPLAIAATAIGAVGQIQAGRAQAASYKAQAKQAEIQGKQGELQYKQQGLEVLKNVNKNLASVVSRAASGGMDPYSGSALSLQRYATTEGYNEYFMTEENAALQMATAEINAQQYRSAASQAKRQGWFNAIATVGQSALMMSSMGGAPGAGAGAGAPAPYTSPYTGGPVGVA